MAQPPFQTSKEFKSLFNDLFEGWRRKHPGGMEELANRCGVSPAYLSQVRRYGRIPGKPVLILLGLHFDMGNPERLFRAASVEDTWPLEKDLTLSSRRDREDGLFSIRLNSSALQEIIRDAVRSESRGKSLNDLLGSRKLRIGLNLTQKWMFSTKFANGESNVPSGVFVDLCEMLAISIQRQVEFVPTKFVEYPDKLREGRIDMFGPVMAAPRGSLEVHYSTPMYRTAMGALYRLRPTAELEPLPLPESVDDVTSRPYKTAVLRNSLAHLIAAARFNRTNDQLIVCESEDEAIERLLLSGIARPAHIYVCSAPMARGFLERHPKKLKALFAERGGFLDLGQNSLAMRYDWGDVLPSVNESLQFLLERGGYRSRLEREVPKDIRGYLEF